MNTSIAPIAPFRRLRAPLAKLTVVALLAGLSGVVLSAPGVATAAPAAVSSPMQETPAPPDTAPPVTAPPVTAPPVTAPPVAPPVPEAPPPSLPPDLPVVEPPLDPSLPPPPPAPPLPDPSPQVAVVLAQLHMIGLRSTLDAAQAKLDQVAALEAKVQAIVDSTSRDRDAKRKALTDAATAAYVQGGVDEVGDRAQVSSPEASVSIESARMLAGSAIEHTHDELVAAEARLRLAQRALDIVQQRSSQARSARDTAQQEMDTANLAIAQAQAAGVPFADLSPPVLGEPTLTVDEIVGWYQSKGINAWAGAVDLPTMVGYYLTEGTAEGVRGDVAFAQAMVETGAFTSPLTRHNNFAGIGACDSCPTGFDFGSPQLGVRAQMQLLHAYADKTLTILALANPAVGADPDHLSVRGCCTTWNKLTGTWATDPNYGPKIMTIYLSMLQFAYAQRTAPAPTPAPAPALTPPATGSP
jgi:hypothetical protein